MLYPLKVGESLSESPQNRQSREEQEEGVWKRDIPCRTAALDAAWKTWATVNQSNNQ